MEHLNPTSWSLCIMLVLLTFMHSCSSSAARSLGNVTDRMALLDMKLQMNDPSGFLNSWNDSQHHCRWPGVGCNRRHQRVIELTLRGKDLSGNISPHIGNLSFMKEIHLGQNSFRGGIPHQLGQLSRLSLLNLSFNLLSGEIPVNLTRCSKIRFIYLFKNQLTGNIPAELGSLSNLEALGLAGNSLTGEIPASLGNLSSSLVRISLGYNNLEGNIPNELGTLSRLIFLGLGPNTLRGEIPPSWFNISTLVYFVLSDCFLSGKLPINLGLNLPILQRLEFGGNNFHGEIPVSVANCTKIEVLELANNTFQGTVPPSVGKLQYLQYLNLQNNFLHGNIQDFLVPLTNCTNLIVLSLITNNFVGELPNTIGNLSTQLNGLFLADNKISGTLPIELGNLVRLESLTLAKNSLTGVIPENLAKLQSLNRLLLQNNGLSGQILPTFCKNMTKLYSLNLSDNNFGGDLSYISQCPSLQKLWISGNKFSGSIPSQMFGSDISSIQIVLSSNLLNGTLPVQVGKLASLQQLDVSQNKLSGDIPSTIGGCSAIEFIDMHNNHFSGSLPPTLASLKGIEYLDLSDNSLSGKIPIGLNQLVYLKHLNISYNDLEGEVPTDGVFSNASQIMLQGNTKLCGGIFELGLSACPIVQQKTKWEKHLKIILIPLLSVLALCITLFLYLFFRKKSKEVRTRMLSFPNEKDILRVSYNDLYRATDEFSPSNLIGSGGFGFVYKGSLVLEHGEIKVVAVKVLDLKKRGASKSFKAECKALSNLRHRNLVPLLTYCSSIDHKGDEFKALVYKYMENGSLDMWLHPDKPHEPPRWLNLLQRINVAINVASALDHLHNHSHIAVAHCDVKPSNILLDNELTAYVGDFGLAMLLTQLQQEASSSTIAIKGTIGYAAPEYAMGLEVSTEGDVYSFGIMLLEMFTGRRPTNDAFTEGLDLHNFVKEKLSDQFWEIVDPSLHLVDAKQHFVAEAAIEDGNTQECLVSILKIGIKCSQAAAKDRMNMKQVARDLYIIRDALRVR